MPSKKEKDYGKEIESLLKNNIQILTSWVSPKEKHFNFFNGYGIEQLF